MDAPSSVVDADPDAPDDPSASTEAELIDGGSDRVLLGVAGYVADGLDLDPLWVRLTFVVLALAGGVGIVIYLAVWLVLFGPDRTGMPWLRYAGGAIVLVGLPIMITDSNLEFFDGPVAVVALLIGLTLALWQPRAAATSRTLEARPLPPPLGRRADSTFGTTAGVAPEGGTGDGSAVEERDSSGDEPYVGSAPERDQARQQRVRRRRPRHEPSILGRATLGLAVIVAATGALIDQLNGGRLHPEQWLGAAALVCGVGLLVGVVRGRAWWLIVPALLFAGVGYLAGVMSRLEIDAVDAFGDQSLYVSGTTPGGNATLQTGFGSIWMTVDGAPVDPLTIDARVAIGEIELHVADDVAIEVRSESDRGDLIVNGIDVSGGVHASRSRPFAGGDRGRPIRDRRRRHLVVRRRRQAARTDPRASRR